MKVLVLHASALHLGFLGCYGNTWIATPHLDRLAAEGIVFDHHFADNLGHRTFWTGQFHHAVSAHAPRLPELLPANGYRFAHVEGNSLASESDASPLERTLEATVETLQQMAGQPSWLCWVDLPSLYPPWKISDEFTLPYLADEPDEESENDDEPFEPLLEPVIGPLNGTIYLWERLRSTYAGVVTYLDAGLGLLFEELKERHLFDDLTIIFTGDRGLALGEHGIVGDCQPWLHDEVVHLPLVVRNPRGTGAGQRISALTQPVDLAASLLDFFGIAVPTMDGRSCLPLLAGNMDALREHGISTWNLAGKEEWALRRLDCALLMPVEQQDNRSPRAVQFYLKPEDRWELNNVIQHHLERAEELQEMLSRKRLTATLDQS